MDGPPSKRPRLENGSGGLPPGWTEHKAPTGHTYYYHKETKKSTYKRPEGAPASSDRSTHPSAGSGYDTFSSGYWSAPASAPQSYQPHQQRGYSNGHFQAHPVPSLSTYYNNTAQVSGAQNTSQPLQEQRKPFVPRPGPKDRPKRKEAIKDCAPWVLVYTKLKRRFVHNLATGESFWKFPADVMTKVIAHDQAQLKAKYGEKIEGERGTRKEDVGIDKTQAVNLTAEDEKALEQERQARGQALEREKAEDELLLESNEEERVWVPSITTPAEKDYDSSEYEEVYVTDDSDAEQQDDDADEDEDAQAQAANGPLEFDEDDIAYQLAAMEAEYGVAPDSPPDDDDEEDMTHSPQRDDADDADTSPTGPLAEAKQIFHAMLSAHNISPFTPWTNLLDPTTSPLLTDPSFTILPSARLRHSAFDEWCTARIASLRAERAAARPIDPREVFLAFLAGEELSQQQPQHSQHAPSSSTTTAAAAVVAAPEAIRKDVLRLYWPEFKRRHKRAAALKPTTALPEREMDSLYREFARRVKEKKPGVRVAELRDVLGGSDTARTGRDAAAAGRPQGSSKGKAGKAEAEEKKDDGKGEDEEDEKEEAKLRARVEYWACPAAERGEVLRAWRERCR